MTAITFTSHYLNRSVRTFKRRHIHTLVYFLCFKKEWVREEEHVTAAGQNAFAGRDATAQILASVRTPEAVIHSLPDVQFVIVKVQAGLSSARRSEHWVLLRPLLYWLSAVFGSSEKAVAKYPRSGGFTSTLWLSVETGGCMKRSKHMNSFTEILSFSFQSVFLRVLSFLRLLKFWGCFLGWYFSAVLFRQTISLF